MSHRRFQDMPFSTDFTAWKQLNSSPATHQLRIFWAFQVTMLNGKFHFCIQKRSHNFVLYNREMCKDRIKTDHLKLYIFVKSIHIMKLLESTVANHTNIIQMLSDYEKYKLIVFKFEHFVTNISRYHVLDLSWIKFDYTISAENKSFFISKHWILLILFEIK